MTHDLIFNKKSHRLFIGTNAVGTPLFLCNFWLCCSTYEKAGNNILSINAAKWRPNCYRKLEKLTPNQSNAFHRWALLCQDAKVLVFSCKVLVPDYRSKSIGVSKVSECHYRSVKITVPFYKACITYNNTA